MKEPTYNHFTRGTHYFSKRMSFHYLLNHEKDIMFRISLKKCAKSFYHVLEKNKEELDKLTRYINRRLNIFLELKGVIELHEIIRFIVEVCNNYKDEAMIENSLLEMKRVDALEYTNENGIQAGHTLQAITRAYKEISTQYERLTIDLQKTYALGSDIVKRSNITKEQLLEIPEDKRLMFYEMLIKSEKYILEKDIETYIQRNLYQFSNLITHFEKNKQQQAEEVFYAYLELVRINEPQIDYLNFIKKKKLTPISDVNRETLVQDIISQMKLEDEDKLLNVSTNINSLIDQFFTFKNLTTKREGTMRVALSYFADFLSGDKEEYKPINIQDLNAKDILNFQNLLLNTCPKNKKTAKFTLFQMVRLRREHNYARYAVNSVSGFSSAIKQFWMYIAKYHKNIALDRDLIDIFNPEKTMLETKEFSSEQDASIRAFTMSELNLFMKTAYAEKELRKTLLSSPRSFFVFIFSLLTGTRLEESLLIALDDIKVQEKHGKRYFYVYLSENKEYQHLKNTSAHRNIPITDLMIELGVLNHIQKRHKQNYKTLFDFPDSASAALAIYFRRYFHKLFPAVVDSRDNRNLKIQENFIQFRSLRKNYSNFLFTKNRTEYDTESNKKQLIGHSHGITSKYLGRLEPFIGYTILNAISYEELDFVDLKKSINNFYGEIITDLIWLDEKNEEWKKVSKVKSRRGRKI